MTNAVMKVMKLARTLTPVPLIVTLLAAPALASPGLFPELLIENTTGWDDYYFLGAPDGVNGGLGSFALTFDFGDWVLVNGPGADFNLYEGLGRSEFNYLDIYVGFDTAGLVQVDLTQTAMVPLDGFEGYNVDDSRGNPIVYGYSLPEGMETARYLRIVGTYPFLSTATGSLAAPRTYYGFDLNAVGAVNYARVPEPAPLWMIGLGLLAVWPLARRVGRRR